jgi:hydrogenase maturation protease
MPAPVLVVGIGNAVFGDDGLGVHAVEALRHDANPGRPALPAGVDLLDGGTAGLGLLPAIGHARALVIIDAVDVGATPGSVHVLTGADLSANQVRLSVHQLGASDLLAAARLTGTLPDRVVLVGAQPATADTGVDLSPAMAAALPRVLALVRDWCHRLASEQEVP